MSDLINKFKENKIIYGLIGYPLEHSYSPILFNDFFLKNNIHDSEYLLFPLTNIEDIKDLILENKNIKGLNVTSPYKQAVIPFLDAVDGIVNIIGAVNTIKIERQVDKILLKGFNTDFGALLTQIQVLFPDLRIDKALILGTGGAALTAEKVVQVLKAKVYFATRNPSAENHIYYKNLHQDFLQDLDIIINATPVGMFPNVDLFPDIPYNKCSNKTIFLDLIYNPKETLFIKKAKEIGAKTANGMLMLNIQAAAAWHLWQNP